MNFPDTKFTEARGRWRLESELCEMTRIHKRTHWMVDWRDRAAGEGCGVLEAKWEQGEKQISAVEKKQNKPEGKKCVAMQFGVFFMLF